MSFSLKGILSLDTSGFSNGIKSASEGMDGLTGKSRSTASSIAGMSGVSKEASSSFSGITGAASGAASSITGIVGAAAGFIGLSMGIKDTFDTFVSFEKKMSNVKAVSGASADELEGLTAKAREMGKLLPASASDAAEAEGKLASAGFSANEIMDSLYGTLTLSQSAQVDMATAADISSSALRGFGLEASQAGHVADVLALTASKTNAEIVDTGEAMKYVAPVAKSAGESLEETAAMIGLLANAGIKGSQAGTTLRAAFVRFQKPSKQASDTMAELGFHAYDSSGKMKSMSTILGELKDKTSGLSDEQRDNAIATIFGTEALSGMKVLMDAGKPAIDDLTDSFKNADGASADMAKTQTDNVYGAIENVKGSFEDLQIGIMKSGAPAIKGGINLIATAIDDIPNEVEYASNTIQEKLSGMADYFSTGFSTAIENVQVIWNEIVGGIDTSKFQAIADNVIPIFGYIGEAILGLYNNVIFPVGVAIAPMVSTVINTVADLLLGLIEILRGVVEFLAGVFTGNWAQAWEGIKTIVFGITDEIKAAVMGIIDTVAGVANAIGNLFSKVKSGVTGSWKVAGSDEANANGTSYFGGGSSLVNERGGEMQVLPSGTSIIPADRTRQMIEGSSASGGNQVTIHIDARGMDADQLVTQLQLRLANI